MAVLISNPPVALGTGYLGLPLVTVRLNIEVDASLDSRDNKNQAHFSTAYYCLPRRPIEL